MLANGIEYSARLKAINIDDPEFSIHRVKAAIDLLEELEKLGQFYTGPDMRDFAILPQNVCLVIRIITLTYSDNRKDNVMKAKKIVIRQVNQKRLKPVSFRGQ